MSCVTKINKLYLPSDSLLVGPTGPPGPAAESSGIRVASNTGVITVVAANQVIPMVTLLQPDPSGNMTLNPIGFVEVSEPGLYLITHQIYAGTPVQINPVGAYIGISDTSSTIPTGAIIDSSSGNTTYTSGSSIETGKTILYLITQPTRFYLVASVDEALKTVLVNNLIYHSSLVIVKV